MFKVLKAEDFIEERLRYPGWLSPKYDGIRAVCRNGSLWSSTNKPIPNKRIREKFSGIEHADFELIHGNPTDPDVFNRTTSIVRRMDGEADNVFAYVFDHVQYPEEPYYRRHERLVRQFEGQQDVIIVPQLHVCNREELLERESEYVTLGYEGAMYRDPHGIYKYGRSTVNEGIIVKIKRFADAECRIIGFEEQMQNNNAAFKDETGRTKRSMHQENMVGKNTLGAFIAVGINGKFKDVLFNIGIGVSGSLTDAQRKYIWEHRHEYLNKVGTYCYFPVGSKDAPRFPKWKGLRMEGDFE